MKERKKKRKKEREKVKISRNYRVWDPRPSSLISPTSTFSFLLPEAKTIQEFGKKQAMNKLMCFTQKFAFFY